MMKLSRSKLIPVTTFVALSAISLFAACGGSKSDSGSGSGMTAEQKKQKEAEEKKKKLEEEGNELVAYVFGSAGPKKDILTVMTSKGKEILTANEVKGYNVVSISHSIVAYETTDNAFKSMLHVFNRDKKELFKLDDAETKKRVDSVRVDLAKVSNTLVAVYKDKDYSTTPPTDIKKLTVYNLQGQPIVDYVDAKDDYKISDTLIAYQTPAHKLIVKDTAGNPVMEENLADMSAGTVPGGVYQFRFARNAFVFQRQSDGKFVAYNDKKVEIASATAPSVMAMIQSHVLTGEVGPAGFKDIVITDLSGKELKKIPTLSDIRLSKNHAAIMDSSKQWTVTNMAGDKTLFGPASVEQNEMKLRGHFFYYFDATNVIVKTWTNPGKDLVNARLSTAVPAAGGPATATIDKVLASDEVISYLDDSGKRVFINYEGKQLVAPLQDIYKTILTSTELK